MFPHQQQQQQQQQQMNLANNAASPPLPLPANGGGSFYAGAGGVGGGGRGFYAPTQGFGGFPQQQPQQQQQQQPSAAVLGLYQQQQMLNTADYGQMQQQQTQQQMLNAAAALQHHLPQHHPHAHHPQPLGQQQPLHLLHHAAQQQPAMLHTHHHHLNQLQHHHHHHAQSHGGHAGFAAAGPWPATVDLDSLPKHAPNPVATQHQQLQMQCRQLSVQSQQPHHHARQAAQVARSSAQLAKTSSAVGTPGGSNVQLLDDLDASGNGVRKSVDSGVGGKTGNPITQQQQQSAADAKKQATADTSHPYVQHRILAQRHAREHPWSMLDIGGMMIRAVESMSPLFRTYSFLTALYLNHNQITFLPPAVGKLSHLVVLDVSFNRLRYLPAEIGQLRQLHELWLFDNLLETLPWELAWLKKLTFLGIEGNPLMKPNIGVMSDMDRRFEHPVAELVFRAGPKGLLQWMRDQMPVDIMVPFAPPRRRWIRRVPATEKASDPADEPISFLSYNVLCERYATQGQYWYTPSWALRWDFRRNRILQEILELDADVVCIQEMDWAQYEEFWVPRLCGEVKPESMQLGGYTRPVDPDSSHQYSACFYPKSRYRSMSEKAKRSPGGGVDGCATFWRRRALQPVGQPFTVEFAQLALGRSDFQKNDTMFARFCSKDNIALAIVLERMETKQRVLVTNVHIHWDPLQTDVKLVQSYMLMDQLEKFTKKFLREHSHQQSGGKHHLPTIITRKSSG